MQKKKRKVIPRTSKKIVYYMENSRINVFHIINCISLDMQQKAWSRDSNQGRLRRGA